jgi:Fungal specific transcription factor domain
MLYSSSPIASVNLQGTPTIFSLADMRLFHHFLIDAYPHLPVGNDSAWLSQVPLIAHHVSCDPSICMLRLMLPIQNEYLMHAILGMSASHLELLTEEPLGTIAIHHRLLAVQGSNAALSQKTRTGSDGDALLGSCYLLAFQASYMRDGLFEFFTMVRGCSLLSGQLREENLPMAFFLTEKDHFQFMEERLLDLPVISSELVEGAQTSLAMVKSLCCRPYQIDFHQLLDNCVEAVRLSSLRGKLPNSNAAETAFTDRHPSLLQIRLHIPRHHSNGPRNIPRVHGFQQHCRSYIDCKFSSSSARSGAYHKSRVGWEEEVNSCQEPLGSNLSALERHSRRVQTLLGLAFGDSRCCGQGIIGK